MKEFIDGHSPLMPDEHLLKIDNTRVVTTGHEHLFPPMGFLTKLNKDGSIPKAFLTWKNKQGKSSKRGYRKRERYGCPKISYA